MDNILEKTNHVYKTTHINNGEFYIGSRTSNDWDNRYCSCDIYSGSFSYTKWKYEIDQSNLEKEILIYGLSREETINLEYFLIDKFFNNPKNVNIINPLDHNFSCIDTSGTVPVKNLKNNETYRVSSKEYYEKNHLKHITKNLKRPDLIKRNKENHPWVGKSHSEETKTKMSKARKKYWTNEKKKEMSKKMSGENSPMYNIPRAEHPSSKKVKHIKSGKIFNSILDTAEYFDVSRKTITYHCQNKAKKPRWKFL